MELAQQDTMGIVRRAPGVNADPPDPGQPRLTEAHKHLFTPGEW